jgi:DNA-binding transcriptional regulator YhcF (GntR family)
MEFRESQPIYLQIAEFVCEKILLKEWKAGERIPSVRELAVALQVNPNTVMRTYEFLQQKDIIFNQRGVGLFVSEDGYKSALAYRRSEFIQKEMPSFFRSLALLQMELEELEPYFKKIKKTKAY